jgi:Mg-chelatase subunit ChlD
MKQIAVFGSSVLVTLLLMASCSSETKKGKGGAGGNGSTGQNAGAGDSGAATAGSGSGINIGSSTTPATTATALPPDSTGLQVIPAERRTEFEGNACDGWSVEPEIAPSAVVFVVDVSGTMNSSTDSTGDATKYDVTRDALKLALSGLPDNLQVGLTFYPNMNNGGSRTDATDLNPCINQSDDVAVGVLGATGAPQRKALLAALDAVMPNSKGATPTHDAFNIARDMLAKQPADVGKYIAILTDGQPTLLEGCYGRAAPKTPEEAQPIIDAIGAAYDSLSLKTFLVGSPGSEENQGTGEDVRGWLSAAARAGQTSTTADCSDNGPNYCHLDMTQAADFGAALTAGLDTIAKRVVVKCLYDVPVAPDGQTIDPNSTNLVYGDGTGASYLVLQNGAETCDKGFHFINDMTMIEICGSTCEQLTSNAKASLSLLFGCSAITTANPLQ